MITFNYFYADLIHGDYVAMNKMDSVTLRWALVQKKEGVNYIGVPVVITYDNGRFDLVLNGMQTLTSDVTSPPQPRWFVTFYVFTEVELSFTQPRINDFNPQ